MSSAESPSGSWLATRAAGVTGRRKSPPEPQPDDVTAETGRSRTARLGQLLRRHWLLSLLLAAGLVLRVLAVIAYLPALIYVDTLKYLYGASPGSDPLGYKFALKIVLLFGNLTVVAVLQHLLGLAIAVVLYVLLLRKGAPRWLAALAAAPVLLDGYQLQMEQTIMPDVLFEALLVAGLAVLLWRPAVTVRVAVAGGLILGASATVRQVGEITIIPAVVWLVFAAAGDGWRRTAGRLAALVLAFAVPILAYSSFSYERYGHFRLGRGQPTIGRTAAAADCATLRVRPLVKAICPTPAEQAQGPDFLEHSKYSPLYSTSLPPGAHRGKLIAALNAAIRHQQPMRVGVAILRDSVRLFSLTKAEVQSVTPISRWQFQTSYPVYPNWVKLGPGNTIIVGIQPKAFGPFVFHPLRPAYGGKAHVNKPIASFLRTYQLDGGYTPGPLLALALLASVAGSLLALRRRARSGSYRPAALACLLMTVIAGTILLSGDIFEFSWRYQLPALVTLPPACVLGITAMIGWVRARRTTPAAPATPETPPAPAAPAGETAS